MPVVEKDGKKIFVVPELVEKEKTEPIEYDISETTDIVGGDIITDSGTDTNKANTTYPYPYPNQYPNPTPPHPYKRIYCQEFKGELHSGCITEESPCIIMHGESFILSEMNAEFDNPQDAEVEIEHNCQKIADHFFSICPVRIDYNFQHQINYGDGFRIKIRNRNNTTPLTYRLILVYEIYEKSHYSPYINPQII